MEINIPIEEIMKNCYSKDQVDYKIARLKEEIFEELAKRISCQTFIDSKQNDMQSVIIDQPQSTEYVDAEQVEQIVTHNAQSNVSSSSEQTPIYNDIRQTNSQQYEYIKFDQSRFQ